MDERRKARLGRCARFLAGGAILLASFASGCNHSSGRAPEGRSPAAMDEVRRPSEAQERRYLVKFKPFAARGSRLRTVSHLRASLGEGTSLDEVYYNTYVVRLAESADRAAAVARLEGAEDVEYVEPDAVVRSFEQPSDPEYRNQWAHAVVDSARAWDLGKGSTEVVVALVDTGMDYRHPDLEANVWRNPAEVAGNGVDDDGDGLVDDVVGWNFVGNNSDPMADDSHTHGTHVGGIIGAVGGNNLGVVGAAPTVRLMPLKFLASNGYGNVSDAVRAIHYAIDHKARIISNSWGGSQGSQALAEAIARARESGILFVAAAGNGGQDGVGDNNDQVATYPASYGAQYDNVIVVAATDRQDNLTAFSNYGPGSVHIGAPGQDILSTLNDGRYGNMSGTSMATPLVSGIAALMAGLRPGLSYLQIKQTLLDTADRVSGLSGRVLSGRVNAYRAMSAIADPSQPLPTPTPQPTQPPEPVLPPAPAPLLGGQSTLVINNPYVQIPVDYDVSAFAAVGATTVYFEVSRPNTPFQAPGGVTPDPYRLIYTLSPGVRNRIIVYPPQHLPGWGTYFMRIIPLDAYAQPVGTFSAVATLVLRPY